MRFMKLTRLFLGVALVLMMVFGGFSTSFCVAQETCMQKEVSVCEMCDYGQCCAGVVLAQVEVEGAEYAPLIELAWLHQGKDGIEFAPLLSPP